MVFLYQQQCNFPSKKKMFNCFQLPKNVSSTDFQFLLNFWFNKKTRNALKNIPHVEVGKREHQQSRKLIK